MSDHLSSLLKDGKRKNEFTVKFMEGDKVKKIDSCRILFMDDAGVTVEELKILGKNRVYYIPNFRLVSIRSELI